MRNIPRRIVVITLLLLVTSCCIEPTRSVDQTQRTALPTALPSNTAIVTWFVPSSTPLPTHTETATPVYLCHKPLRDAIDWPSFAPRQGSTHEWGADAVPRVVQAGEIFLNSCLNPNLAPKDQREVIEEFSRLAQLIDLPPDCTGFAPIVRVLDLDNDDVEELVLHTTISPSVAEGESHCIGKTVGCCGALSIVYDLDMATRHWHGTSIWPIPAQAFSMLTEPEPQVIPLSIQGSEDAFVLVIGTSGRADSLAKLLTVWRWDDKAPEVALELTMSDWCGYPNWDQWEITEEGGILIPATEATARCEAQEAVVWVLSDDGFIPVKQ